MKSEPSGGVCESSAAASSSLSNWNKLSASRSWNFQRHCKSEPQRWAANCDQAYASAKPPFRNAVSAAV